MEVAKSRYYVPITLCYVFSYVGLGYIAEVVTTYIVYFVMVNGCLLLYLQKSKVCSTYPVKVYGN